MKKTLILIIPLALFFTGCGILDKQQEVSQVNINEVVEEVNENTNTEKEIKWEEYSTEDFSFQYPSTVEFIDDYPNNPDNMMLKVEIDKLKDIDEKAPLGMGKDTAKKDFEALKTGSYGEDIDFSSDNDKRTFYIDGYYGKHYLVFTRFEVCDVTFERNLIFYIEDKVDQEESKRVKITLYGPTEKIKKTNPYFFSTTENCPTIEAWKENLSDTQDSFYRDLTRNEASQEAQEWFYTFTDIINTIEINQENVDNEFTVSNEWQTFQTNIFNIDYPSNFFAYQPENSEHAYITNYDPEKTEGGELGPGQLKLDFLLEPGEEDYFSCESEENKKVVKCEKKIINNEELNYIEFKNELFNSHNLILGNDDIVVYALMSEEDFNNNVDLVNQIFSTLVISESKSGSAPISQHEEWAEHEEKGYTFKLPGYFLPEITKDETIETSNYQVYLYEVTYKDQNGNELATLNCPMPETGYIGWEEWEEKRKENNKDDKRYGTTLKFGYNNTYLNNEGDIALLLMHRGYNEFGGKSDQEFKDNYEESCQFTFKDVNADDKEMIEKIYNSIY